MKTFQNSELGFYKGKRVVSHRRSDEKGKSTTIKEHMPKKHQKYAEWTSEKVMAWAEKQGSSIKLFVEKIMRKYPNVDPIFNKLSIFVISKLNVMTMEIRKGMNMPIIAIIRICIRSLCFPIVNLDYVLYY